MKIVLIIPTLGKGGAERVVSNLSKGFTELGHDVYVIIFSGPVAYETHGSLTNYGINYSSPSKVKILFNLLRCVCRLKKDIKRIKPDCVFSFMEFANFCTILSRKNSCVSIRVSLSHITPLSKKISKLLYPKAKKVIAVSSALARDLEEEYHLKNVSFVYNPLSFDHLDALKIQPIDRNENFILSVGRLENQKNFSLLINSYAGLFAESGQTIPKLLIFGDGELKESLKKQIIAIGMESKIFLMGNTTNPYKYMKACQLFVLPSLYEGFPNVLIEAMACGAVCIATDCPTGPNEIIKHGENGFLVANNNVDAMRSMLKYCLYDNNNFDLVSKCAIESTCNFALKITCLKYLEQAN